MISLNIAIYISLIFIFRELLYHIFIIKPFTNLKGNYARKIEEIDIIEWVKPKIKEETPEIAFVGNSHVMDAVDPKIVSEIVGKSTYNLALYYIPTPNILEILLKFDCFPKTIFIDISSRYSMYNSAYEFYLDVIKSENKPQNTLKNKISWFLPSFFVPNQFGPIEYRSLKKIIHFYKNPENFISRYSPFRLLTSFDWSLDIDSNHRIVNRKRKISELETKVYYSTLNKTIQETKQLCFENHPDSQKSFEIWDEFLSKAQNRNCKVFIVRLPMDKKLINFENDNCSFYFDKIKAICNKYKFNYLDLNEQLKDLSFNDFYIDGQHVTHLTAIKISKYLSKEIIKIND